MGSTRLSFMRSTVGDPPAPGDPEKLRRLLAEATPGDWTTVTHGPDTLILADNIRSSTGPTRRLMKTSR